MSENLPDVPEQIESKRLIIRALRDGDALGLNKAIVDSLPQLKPWMVWASKAPTLAETELHCKLSREKFLRKEDLQLVLFKKATGEVVGSSGLHNINWKIPKFEIGYWCNSKFLGQGFITEAVDAISKFAFMTLGAKRIEIRCDPENEKSKKIPERLGFQLEGRLRNEDLSPNGEVRDTLVYSKI